MLAAAAPQPRSAATAPPILLPVKNYPTLKFMLPVVAAATDDPCFLPFRENSSLLKIYCCYFVCVAYAQSVSDS